MPTGGLNRGRDVLGANVALAELQLVHLRALLIRALEDSSAGLAAQQTPWLERLSVPIRTMLGVPLQTVAAAMLTASTLSSHQVRL
jgi:hypothetical protein